MTAEPLDVLWCASNAHYEHETGGHTVTFGPSTPGAMYSVEYQCTCGDQSFVGSESESCEHIQAAARARCGYGWEASHGAPADLEGEDECPKCGGPLSVVTIAI